MRTRTILGLALAAAVAIGGACTAKENGEDEDDGGGNGQGAGPNDGGGGTIFDSTGGGDTGGMGPCVTSEPDADSDGFTVQEGDCNDCDPNMNPGAVEVPTDPMDRDAVPTDENCNNETDEAIPTCDTGMSYTDADPMNAVKAMELCQTATPTDKMYGVISATWVHANGMQAGAPMQPQFGIQQNFGQNVPAQRGENMVMLSSGYARLPGQNPVAVNQSASAQGFTPLTPPMNFPQDVPGCMGSTEIYDDIGLDVRLRAPTNATGFNYLFKFYSFEFAEYVCTQFNDQYIALMDPAPMGSINGNISFDSMSNPVSVNIAFFDVCDPVANNDFAAFCFGSCPPMPMPYCPSGPGELAGSGFDDCFGSNAEDAGGTSWLQTTAPVDGGTEFSIRFAIWDTGDNAWDSTVLIDGFEWIATPGTTVVTQPPPE